MVHGSVLKQDWTKGRQEEERLEDELDKNVVTDFIQLMQWIPYQRSDWSVSRFQSGTSNPHLVLQGIMDRLTEMIVEKTKQIIPIKDSDRSEITEECGIV